MFPNWLKTGFVNLFNPVINFFIWTRVKPNWLTTAGFLFGLGSGLLFATGHFFWGGLVALLSAICDAIDGSLARLSGNVTKFGMFYDSVLDRYSELAMFIGLSFFYSTKAMWLQALLTDLALVGSLMVSYTRARAEGLGEDCKVGIMERPERIAVIITASVFTGIFDQHWIFEIALWVLAVFTNVTALQRILHIRQKTKGQGIP
ncbi:TPA: CDP-alcohol phosphatidyltransferase family protein [Candidatus Edwardsbacteria bacterium]|nr:CDP-alcohol phosphatidyltransferase family protein [Candidatus Edwardsbacteria bacterium]